MSSAVSKPLQSSGERMQGYACLAAAMALVGSTVVASKIIAAGLPFHRHRAALRAGAALLLLIMKLTGASPASDSARATGRC